MLKHLNFQFLILFLTLTSFSLAQVTVEEVLSGLEKREKAIKDLRIMYQFVRAKTPEDVKAMKENPDIAGKGYYYFTKQIDLFAMSTEKYVYEHLVNTNGSRYQSGLDHWHIIRAVDLIKNKGYFWEHTSNRLSISGPDIPYYIKLNFITTSPYVNGQLFQIYWPLSQMLRKYQNSQVEKIDTVDGDVYCTLLFTDFYDEGNNLQPNQTMRYKINITKGYTPVCGQRLDNNKVVTEYNYLEIKNFGGDIWLPMKTEFSSDMTGSPEGKPRTAELKVLNIKVNENPPADWLDFKKPKGCYVSENNEWPPKNADEVTEEEMKEGWKTGEKLTREEEANYFESLFGISYPEVIQLFDKIEY